MTELLQLGPRLRDWLQQDPGWRDLPLPRRARLHWSAAWSGLNERLSATQRQDAPPLADPVFVLGPWRSGSTAMHELLVAASGLPTPLTWQCMNASAFLLSAAPRDVATAARPMDGLPVGALSPQEDEFALLSLGADSLYRAFWQPHRAAELMPLLEASHWVQSGDWLPIWEGFLHGVLRARRKAGAPLLLKSPNHSLRWAALRQRFPAARAVWMLRDAASVYHSNLKMWHQMAALHGLTPAPAGALDALLAAALQALATALQDAMAAAQPPHLVWQPQLREAPRDTVVQACAALDLPCEPDSAGFAAALQAVAQGRSERYEDTPLPPAAQAAVQALDAAQAQAWSTFSARR